MTEANTSAIGLLTGYYIPQLLANITDTYDWVCHGPKTRGCPQGTASISDENDLTLQNEQARSGIIQPGIDETSGYEHPKHDRLIAGLI
jgi:hypothetical protein